VKVLYILCILLIISIYFDWVQCYMLIECFCLVCFMVMLETDAFVDRFVFWRYLLECCCPLIVSYMYLKSQK